MNHTPGPWKYVYEGSGDYLVIGHDGTELGTAWSKDAHFLGEGSASDRNEANARLIAAAPALLAALEALCYYPSIKCWNRYGCVPTDLVHDKLCLMARAALALARGETP